MPSRDWNSWSRTPLKERVRWLARLRRLAAKQAGSLCDAVCADTAKSRFEALTQDVAPFLASCRWLERRAARLLGDRRLGGTPWWFGGLQLVERRVPLGRVAIIATWNYPVQILGVQLAPALLAGNTVVVKPSERAPKSAELLVQLAIEAGLPDKTLTTTPATREAGEALLNEPFDHVVFTGSTAVGLSIAARTAAKLTPSTLELSGRDSAFVLDDADPTLAAAAIWGAVCMNSGQTCMAPRRALVHESIYKAFVEKLNALARRAAPRPLIDEAAARICHEQVVAAIGMGGRDAAGESFGSPNPPTPVSPPIGRLWRPTAVVECPKSAALVEGRHFGPAIAVVRVGSLEEALEIHERCDQHLTASIFTASRERAEKLAPMLGATNIFINDCVLPSAHPGASIGGRGMSGVGLSRGEEGLLAMTRPLYVSLSKGGAKRTLQEPPKLAAAAIGKLIAWSYGGWRA